MLPVATGVFVQQHHFQVYLLLGAKNGVTTDLFQARQPILHIHKCHIHKPFDNVRYNELIFHMIELRVFRYELLNATILLQ
jgi:hypothetical protein